MVLSLTYRTTDNTRWGGGQGTNLTAAQVDINFYSLFTAIEAIENAQADGAGIDFISQPVNGNQIFVHLTDHRVLGPFTLPTANWNPRGQWQPATAYAPFDTVSFNGQLYLVTVPVTSAATFNPSATDGDGHTVYVLILATPENSLPTGGAVKNKLVKASGSPFVTEWDEDHVRLVAQCIGQPDPGETIMQYAVVDHMVLRAGLPGTAVFNAAMVTAPPSVWTITLNGNPIGTIIFNASDPLIDVEFPSDVNFIPGDVIKLVAPASPDPGQIDITFVFVATING